MNNRYGVTGFSGFSNIGDRVDVCAPGEDIIAPLIASLAAMIYALNGLAIDSVSVKIRK